MKVSPSQVNCSLLSALIFDSSHLFKQWAKQTGRAEPKAVLQHESLSGKTPKNKQSILSVRILHTSGCQGHFAKNAVWSKGVLMIVCVCCLAPSLGYNSLEAIKRKHRGRTFSQRQHLHMAKV